MARRSALPVLAGISEAPRSSTRVRPSGQARRPTLAYLGAAGLFLAAFWAFAGASDWFLDAPFHYTTRDEWSQNLIQSAARGVHRAEGALFIVSLFTLVPMVVFLALGLASQGTDSLRALQQLAARRSARWIPLLGLLAAVLAGSIFHWVLRGTELIDDERSYLFAARNLASGTFFRAAVPAAFQNPMILTSPGWLSKYPPGFAGLLSVGWFVGLPRLMPSLICALSILGLFQLAKSLFGSRTALLVSLLWTFSPFQLAIHGTTMIFGTSGCLGLWIAALVARGLLRSQPRALAGAALLFALLVLVRPFDAGLVFVAASVALLAFGPARVAIRRVALLLAGFALGTLGLAAFNARAFGSPWTSGYDAYGGFRLGFFVNSLPGFDYEHTPVQALAHVIVAFARLDSWLIGVPGVMALAALTLAYPSRREQALLFAIAVHLLGYSVVASSGTFDVGPTYYYLVAPLYLLLAVRGALRLKRVLDRKYRALVTWAGVVVVPVAWLSVVPIRVNRLTELASAIRAPWAFLQASDLGRGVVVLPPFQQMHAAGYALGYPYEVRTRTGALQLIRPQNPAELAEALRWFMPTPPVYALNFDEQRFQADGSRHYRLEPLRLEPR